MKHGQTSAVKKIIDQLEPFNEKDETCLNAIVETPKGSRVKYAYDFDTGFLIVTKALPEGMMYPFNFGFIPKTLAEDGDPLDVLILNPEPMIAGCLLKVRPIGVVKAEQTEHGHFVRNDRIVGEAVGKEVAPGLESLELNERTVSQIEFFFSAYNKLYQKKFKVLGTGGPRKATDLVHDAVKAYRKNNNGH